jgi:hypothetical protein
MSTTANPIDRLQELGGELFLQDGFIRYRVPKGNPEARELLAEIRKDRQAFIALLRDRESKPPSLEEVKGVLPPGVKLVNYEPKQAPFAVAPVSVVSNAGRFFRAYLRDLRWRLEHPASYAAPPLTDILSKLADAGLELLVEAPTPRVFTT